MVLMRAMVLAVALAGCSHTSVDIGGPHGGLHAHIEGGRSLATILGLSIVADGIMETERARYAAPPAPTELDPLRRVSEQDCTKPIDYSLGNIHCK